MVHYYDNIKNFGSPNGLCSSITESKHITAVKCPWRRSNCYKALSQILKVNERLDKLAAARADFAACGMLTNSTLIAAILDSLRNDNVDDTDVDNGDNNSNDNDNDDTYDDIDEADNIDLDDEDDDAGPVETEALMNEVQLAHDKGKHHYPLPPSILMGHLISSHP